MSDHESPGTWAAVMAALAGVVAIFRSRASTAARKAEIEAAWQLQMVEEIKALRAELADVRRDHDALVRQHSAAVESLHRTQAALAELRADRDARRGRAEALYRELGDCKRQRNAGFTRL